MTAIDRIHERHVAGRRVRVLAGHLAELLPRSPEVLDVGCGDGRIAAEVVARRPDLRLRGVDVLVRPDTAIPVEPFDGRTLPQPENSVDTVVLVDVLHHCERPEELLAECARVAREWIVIKDHTRQGLLADTTLRFMDRVGNARYGVSLPYNYWRPAQWHTAFQELGLEVDRWLPRLGLYPWPLSLAFERSLHFIARLRVKG